MPLSAREREIMALLAGGASNAKIAERLFMTTNTVRTHLDRIRDKTGARNRADLTRYAIAGGHRTGRTLPPDASACRPTPGAPGGPLGLCRPARAEPYVRLMKRIRFTKAPTFTKAIIAAAIFAIAYLASTSNLPPCSDPDVLLNGGECIERQSFLHTASGWLALVCLVAAVLLLALKHKDAILGRRASARRRIKGRRHRPRRLGAGARAPVPGRAAGFCAKCGTRIIPGDRFCQGCGSSTASL